MKNKHFIAGLSAIFLFVFIAAGQTTFTNSTTITIPDSGSGSPYPSNITVSGLSGNITDVNVRLNSLSHTFPDDVGLLLVSPSGAKMVIQSDVGGGTDIVNRTYTLDDQAASGIPDTGPMPADGTSAKPSSVGDDDTFPAPAPVDCQPAGECPQAAPAGSATLNATFGGASANGTWSLYVIDQATGDSGAVNGGWSIIITTSAAVVADAPVDLNGDGKTDYTLVRNTGGGPPAGITWYTAYNGGGGEGKQWGISTDFFLSEDFDGDNKDDVTVWRPGAQGQFFILLSQSNTVRIDNFGQTGDDPTVIGDYDGDGKADPAVYRGGATAGAQSYWYFRGSLTPSNITTVPWGQNGDFPTPGDYNGDGKNDYVVQRNNGGGSARFWMYLSNGTIDSIVFGAPTDLVVPGDYDGDGKTDITVIRGSGGSILWFTRNSSNGSTTSVSWGSSATDFPTPGDYNGDGKADYAIWRPSATAGQSAFFVLYLTGSPSIFPWGLNGDYPVANFNTH